MIASVFLFVISHYYRFVLPKDNKPLLSVAASDASELFIVWQVPLGLRELMYSDLRWVQSLTNWLA